MLRNLKFPLIYVLEVICYLPLLAGFYVTTLFIASTPIAELQLEGKALPKAWEAAVFNHGMYLEGYLINKHPFIFTISLVLLFVFAFAIYHIRKAQEWQKKEAGAAKLIMHNSANALVFFTIGIIGYLFVFRVLVNTSVSPA